MLPCAWERGEEKGATRQTVGLPSTDLVAPSKTSRETYLAVSEDVKHKRPVAEVVAFGASAGGQYSRRPYLSPARTGEAPDDCFRDGRITIRPSETAPPAGVALTSAKRAARVRAPVRPALRRDCPYRCRRIPTRRY